MAVALSRGVPAADYSIDLGSSVATQLTRNSGIDTEPDYSRRTAAGSCSSRTAAASGST